MIPILGRNEFALRKFSGPTALRIYGLPAAPLCGAPVSAAYPNMENRSI